MEKYLSHLSAAVYWQIPYIEAVLGDEIAKADLVDFTVTTRGERYQVKGQRVYLCTTPLPNGAVILREGGWVASPELVFLQLANELTIQKLILLGLQICSHDPCNPHGALSTKDHLIEFLLHTEKHRGHRKALQAVKYIKDGSNSIMESLVYMVVTLPHSLGGFGLKGFELNVEIELTKEAIEILDRNCCFADLFYRAVNLILEYDSKEHHSDEIEQCEDLIRTQTLESIGYKVMHLTTNQFYDKDQCKNFIFDVASFTNQRIRIRTPKFDEMHKSLRTLFP